MGLRKRPYNDDKKSSSKGEKKSSFGNKNRATEGRFSKNKPFKSSRDDERKKSNSEDKPYRSTPYKSSKPADKKGDERTSSGWKKKTGFKKASSSSTYRSDDNKPFREKKSTGKFNDRKPADSRFKRSTDKPYSRLKSSEDDSFSKRNKPAFNRADKDSDDRRPKRGTRSFDKPFRKSGPSDDSFLKRNQSTFNRSDNDSDDKRPKRGVRNFDKPLRKKGPSQDDSFPKRKRFSDDSTARRGDDRRPVRESKARGTTKMVRGAKARDIIAASEESLNNLVQGEVRLNRFISNAGICSRREADTLIGAGLVQVNGVVITEMGYKVKPGDEVRYNKEKLNWEKKAYLIMNKPKDTITTSDDPEKRKIIMDLIQDPRLPKVYPVGRLDRNTTGVILLTNDGELTQRLTHPKYNVTKVYKAVLNKAMQAKDMHDLVNNGVQLEDGPFIPDMVGLPNPKDKKEVMIQIHSGKNRIIHRTFEALGYLVDKLDRLEFAALDKKGLERGEWRHLTDKELKKLKKLVSLK
ncbi:MAG: pseudouridine synthase [Bacteroidia bacterium]|jgi:23S rRNA pseudouridine2605 synthase|nr:pseudouridine synthase [Bacteroidia bacterium]